MVILGGPESGLKGGSMGLLKHVQPQSWCLPAPYVPLLYIDSRMENGKILTRWFLLGITCPGSGPTLKIPDEL